VAAAVPCAGSLTDSTTNGPPSAFRSFRRTRKRCSPESSLIRDGESSSAVGGMSDPAVLTVWASPAEVLSSKLASPT
jgi:hypothetical protein